MSDPTTQIAAEAAQEISINCVETDPSGCPRFLEGEATIIIKSSIEKAYQEGFVHGRSKRRFCTCDESASDVITDQYCPQHGQLRAAHASSET